MAINFLPREPLGPLGQQKRPWAPRTRLLRGPGSAGACGWGVRGVHDAPGRGSGVAWGKPKQQPTCAAARSERGARRGRAGAPGQPGDGLGEREVHRACRLRASHSRGSGGGPSPRLPPLLHPAWGNGGSYGGVGSNRHRGGGGGGGDTGGGGGGGVCARLAFPPPGLGERGGGEGRAAAGMSRLGPQGTERGTRCPPPPPHHHAL